MTTLAVASALVLAGIWGAYPALVWLVARAVPPRRAPRAWASRPAVSVIVATRDDAEAVRRRVLDLLDADYDPGALEVIVAWDARCGVDRCAPVAVDARVVQVAGDPPGGKATALNAGVRAARGGVLVFADTGQSFARDAIRRLVDELADPAVGAVSGMLAHARGAGATAVTDRYWRYERALRRAEARVHSAVGVTGAIYAMRRARWRPLPAGLLLDDVYVPMRLALARYRIAVCADAIALDARATTPAAEYRRKVRTLTGNIQLCAWMPAVLVPVVNPIWVQFVCHKLLRLLTPYLLMALLVGLAGTVARAAHHAPALGAALGLGGLAVAAATAVIPRVRRSARATTRWVVALQAATLMAALNGARGRWDVWAR